MPTAIVSEKISKVLSALDATDRLLIAFWALLSLLSLSLHARVAFWHWCILANIAAALLLCLIARAAGAHRSQALHGIHHWSAYPLVLFTFKQVYFLIRPLHHGKDYDALLAAIDHALFGLHPTQWLARMANPYVTELLQIAYTLFYVWFLVLGIELYRKRRFASFRFTIVYGFLISYVGYLLLPAVGPRFTLHDFARINTELPGVLFTPALRVFVNFFESIQPGMTGAAALASAQRDVFPSGHTMMMLLMMVFACREKLQTRGAVWITGSLLIFATVYLRYHYVVDILAGALLALLCLYTAPGLQRWIQPRKPEACAGDRAP